MLLLFYGNYSGCDRLREQRLLLQGAQEKQRFVEADQRSPVGKARGVEAVQ